MMHVCVAAPVSAASYTETQASPSVETLSKPLNLLDIYQQALAKDATLLSALKANQASQELIEQGKALYRPTVTFTANASATQTDIQYIGANFFRNEGRSNFEGYNYGVNARQPIFRKQNWVQIDQSKTQVSQADKQLHLTQQQLILRVTQAYFDVLIAQDRIALLQAQKEATQSQLEQAKANFEVGTATITDFNEAKARYDLIVAQEVAAQNAYEVAQFAIQSITGAVPSKLATAKADLRVEPLQSMQNWLDVAMQNNLSIQIQQDALTLAEQEVARNQAGHLPTLDAVASYTKSYANGSVSGFGSDLKSAVIGLQLELPLYQGGAISSQVRQAVLNKQRAEEDIELARRNATLETQRAFLNVNTSMAQIIAFEQALSSAQSQLDSTKLGFEVGVRTNVDVLNAQQLLFSAKRDLLEARYQYLVNTIRLKTASGLVAETDLAEVNQQLVAP
jgi:outer membrane protein